MADERDAAEKPAHEESNTPVPQAEDGPDASTDSKQSRKREREVSLEPGTPQAVTADVEPAHHDTKDHRVPAKKNRVSAQLDAPAEVEETSEGTSPATEGVSGSPPHDSKIRQISQGVEDLTWKNMAKQPTPEPPLKGDVQEDKPMDTEPAGPAHDAQLEQTEVLLHPVGANPPIVVDDVGEDEHTEEADPAEVPPDAQVEDVKVEDVQVEDVQVEDVQVDDAQVEVSPSADAAHDAPETTPSTPPQREASPIIFSPAPNPTTVSRRGSDSSGEEKVLKRKMGDRTVSESTPVVDTTDERETTKRNTAAKRLRDDPDTDENPRLTKRPTPPPDEEKKEESSSSSKTASKPVVAAPAAKTGGFAAYAASSSPFATVKGPSLFANQSSPWASTSTSTFPSASSSPSPKPANGSIVAPSALFNSTMSSTFSSTPSRPDTGTKRGFEAFASSASPFATAAKRPKSPSPAAVPGFGHHRSKSPLQHSSRSANVNAFSAYATGGAHAFATPSRRAGSASVPPEGEDGTNSAGEVPASQGSEDEGSRERKEETESQDPESFSARLRAQKDESDTDTDKAKKPDLKALEPNTGEEDEETVYQVRGKLFTLSDDKIWKEKGTGQLKLNVRRDDGNGARLLMRKEAVYTVLLNVLLFRGMRCSIAADPRYIRFSVFEEGVATHYNLRVSNSKIAEELLGEINAHIPGPGE